MKKTFKVVDMFCGAGGESTGTMQAAAELDMKVDLLAINHWEIAVNPCLMVKKSSPLNDLMLKNIWKTTLFCIFFYRTGY